MRVCLKVFAAGLLLTVGVSVAVNAQDARLASAAERGDRSAVQNLLDYGADVNGPQPDGATALRWAAHWDDLPMVAALIAAGPDLDAANDYGVTPLALAATNGSAEVLDVLLRAAANPDATLQAYLDSFQEGNLGEDDTSQNPQP